MALTRALATNNYGPAKFVVSNESTAVGTHSTITLAMASAVAGDTIFIRASPTAYTENFTLTPGVNISAYPSDSSFNGTGNVQITGKLTMTAAGSVTISGVQLNSGTNAFLAVTGSAASVVNLFDCYLNASTNADNTGVIFSSTNAGSTISLSNCSFNLANTGISYFSMTSIGSLTFNISYLSNGGGSSTSSTISAGRLGIFHTQVAAPITTSGTSAFVSIYGYYSTAAQNVTSLTLGGSGLHTIKYGSFDSGSASSISISNTTSIGFSDITSSNTNAITGAGTLNYSGISFSGSSSLINVTTQSGGLLSGGRFQAPSAGFIGEHIRSFLPIASEITLVSSAGQTVTSIALTAGIWDVSAIILFDGGATTSSTQFYCSISTTGNTIPASTSYGDVTSIFTCAATVGIAPTLVVPSLRVTLSSNTTYYLVAFAIFTVSTMKACGRISATRVG